MKQHASSWCLHAACQLSVSWQQQQQEQQQQYKASNVGMGIMRVHMNA